MNRTLAILLTIAITRCVLVCNAEDRIWLSPAEPTSAESRWYARPVTQVTGDIVQLDQQQLRMMIAGETRESLLAAKRVLWIEPDKLPDDATKAIELYKQRKYSDSIRPFLDALNERPPVWLQQWLSMMAADAAWRGGRPTIAFELIKQLDSRPLPPVVMAWLPIDWDGGAIDQRRDRTSETAALAKLADPSSAVRLVAASWLMRSSSRRDAVAALQKLALDNQRPTIARLAEVVSWRATLPPNIADSADRWQEKVDALPMVLQTGPLECLASLYLAAGLADKAKRLQLALELTPVIPKREK